MRLFNDAAMAMRMMRAKPARSFLSLLGIYIGVLALIVILSLHEGMKRQLVEMYHTEGARVEYVQPIFDPATRKFGSLTLNDAAALGAVPGVLSALPRLSSENETVSPDQHARIQFLGVDEQFMKIYGVPLVEGRALLPDEIARRESVCLLSRDAARLLFPHGSAVGERVRAESAPLMVVGIFDWSENIGQRANIPNQTPPAFVPVAWLARNASAAVNSLELRLDPAQPFDEVTERVRRVLSRGDDRRVGLYALTTMEDTLKQTQEYNRQLLNNLVGIAAISLFVGGIGVANVMLTSVAERTREIGIRKALGARRSDILALFLAESTVMTATSGLCAVLTGWAATQVVPKFVSSGTFHLAFPPLPAAGCFLVTCVIGVVAGLYPASRACMLAPAAALRYE